MPCVVTHRVPFPFLMLNNRLLSASVQRLDVSDLLSLFYMTVALFDKAALNVGVYVLRFLDPAVFFAEIQALLCGFFCFEIWQ